MVSSSDNLVFTLPYQGTKRKVLPQIIDLFPKEEKFDVLYDVFTGSGVVGLNLAKYSDKTICSDICEPLIEMLSDIKNDGVIFKQTVDLLCGDYPNSKEGYLALRDFYNKDGWTQSLYLLIMRSFSNYLRFNKKGEFNLPFGRRFSYNPERLRLHIEEAQKYDIVYQNNDCWKTFSNAFADAQNGKHVFLFCDSPYLGTTATYNEKSGWIENDEVNYYSWLDDLSDAGAKWMVTNTVHNRGFHNKYFEEFASRYNAVQTVSCFKNSSHQKTDKETVELIVTNY